MNLTNLETFLTIAETGSLVRASEALNVTQSTVTARLKNLENELGQTLVHRQKSGAVITASGLRLKRYAETMRNLWRQARQEIALPDGVGAVCNLGCDHGLWQLHGQTLFKNIRKTMPDIAIAVWAGTASEIHDWLRDGLVDLAIGYNNETRAGFTTHQLSPERMVLVSTSPTSPIRFDPDYIYVEAGEEFGRQHAAAYADADTARTSFSKPEWGLQHINQNGGSAYLPYHMVENLIEQGELFGRPEAPEFKRPSYLVTNNTSTRSWNWFDKVLELAKQ